MTNKILAKQRRFNLLIVDDSRLSRKIEIESIRQEALHLKSDIDIEFEQCEDGIDAVNAVMNGVSYYDAIFIDNVMIKMNGLEATRNIRSLGYSGTIVAVSGNVLEDDVDAFLQAGANYFVGKPLEQGRIQDVLQGILNI
jgi:CheY-like chemotaxis protein